MVFTIFYLFLFSLSIQPKNTVSLNSIDDGNVVEPESDFKHYRVIDVSWCFLSSVLESSVAASYLLVTFLWYKKLG
jgi:hypothetical protein